MIKNGSKETILTKTFELLLKEGYDGVSITDIQRAAGVSRGLLYHYYKNKEELFIEVTERYFVDLFKIDLDTVKAFTIPEMIGYMEQKHIEVCQATSLADGSQMSIINYDFLFYQVIRKSPLFAAQYHKIRDDELRTWEIVVQNSIELGELKGVVDVKTTARILVYIIDGAWFNESRTKEAMDVVKGITNILQQYYEQIKK